MATTNLPTGGSPGNPLLIPYASDSKHVPWLVQGKLSAQEDTVLGMVSILLIPSGPSKPCRILLDFDGSLELAHEIISSAARLHRGGQP